MGPIRKIVLINLNAYLGGGETLMVRFAQYLMSRDLEFVCICAEEGYAHRDLIRQGIDSDKIITVESSPNYYYLNDKDRESLINEIRINLTGDNLHFVTFCMRDMYTAYALSLNYELIAITHLVLHIQDDLYVGQTLWNKLNYYITKKRNFNNDKNISFNRNLLSLVSSKGGIICMADLIANVWKRNFPITIDPSHIVPLPSFKPPNAYRRLGGNTRKIIWIGRIVDFKIPAIESMINFLGDDQRYTLTIIGNGDKEKILEAIKKNRIDESRVRFLGEVPYEHLESVIQQHSVGYAMGTSLVELAKFRIPVIVALASYTHNSYKRSICGGLFFNQPLGCDGSELAACNESDIKKTIHDAIEIIEQDWELAADECYSYAKRFYSEEENFNKYVELISQTKNLDQLEKSKRIPQASIFRRFLFKLFG